MKTILFLILFCNTSFLFGMDKPPVSTQKISNATLTCPSGKWCRVQVSISLSAGFPLAAAPVDLTNIDSSKLASKLPEISNINENITIDLKSSDTLNCTNSSVGTGNVASGVILIWRPYVTCFVSGVQFYKKYISVQFEYGGSVAAFNGVFALKGDYSFYSMEYFN